MIKVSVIVPVYNVQKYVGKCIESILAQTLPDIEILCLDDGSTDNSGKILDKYLEKDSRVKVIHKENAGYGAAMNLGLDMAKGEYIGIVESDDFIEANMYEDLYGIAKEMSLDFVKSSYWDYGEDGKKWIDRLTDIECDTVFSKYENMNKIFAPKSIWSGIYKREFLEKNKIRFLETPGASYQDTSFWFKICIMAGRGYFTKKAYVNYRIDNAFSSVNSKEKVYYVCDELSECERYLWDSKLDIKKIYSFFVFYKRAVYVWNLKRISPEYRREYMEKICAELRWDVAHPFMDYSGFYEEWCQDLELLTNYSESYCKYLNEEFSKIVIQTPEDILKLIKQEDIYLYGAGKVGQRLEKIIKIKKPDYLIQYVVSDPINAISGKVFAIENRQLDLRKNIIICVASKQLKQEMIIRAIERGFHKIGLLETNI